MVPGHAGSCKPRVQWIPFFLVKKKWYFSPERLDSQCKISNYRFFYETNRPDSVSYIPYISSRGVLINVSVMQRKFCDNAATQLHWFQTSN